MSDTFCTYYESPLGFLKIAGTDHYISEVTFLDEEEDYKDSAYHQLIKHCVEELI